LAEDGSAAEEVPDPLEEVALRVIAAGGLVRKIRVHAR
jgi:hypothetical protein